MDLGTCTRAIVYQKREVHKSCLSPNPNPNPNKYKVLAQRVISVIRALLCSSLVDALSSLTLTLTLILILSGLGRPLGRKDLGESTLLLTSQASN